MTRLPRTLFPDLDKPAPSVATPAEIEDASNMLMDEFRDTAENFDLMRVLGGDQVDKAKVARKWADELDKEAREP